MAKNYSEAKAQISVHLQKSDGPTIYNYAFNQGYLESKLASIMVQFGLSIDKQGNVYKDDE